MSESHPPRMDLDDRIPGVLPPSEIPGPRKLPKAGTRTIFIADNVRATPQTRLADVQKPVPRE